MFRILGIKFVIVFGSIGWNFVVCVYEIDVVIYGRLVCVCLSFCVMIKVINIWNIYG